MARLTCMAPITAVMESDAQIKEQLRLQFQAMQEQQMQRLRKNLQGSKQSMSEIGESINSEDDRNLSMTDTDRSIMLQHGDQGLQGQIRELKDENGRLCKLLKEKDFEIQHLKRKREEDRLALAGTTGVAGEAASTKIVELSKKNRELAVEIEREKINTKKMRNRVRELEIELQEFRSASPRQKKDQQQSEKSSEEESRELVKSLQEQLATAKLKIVKSRNDAQAFKQELIIAQKVLANEVGENVNMHQLLNNIGSWRGRAQQILVLQNKVRDLETQLNMASHRREKGDADTEDSQMPENGVHTNNQDKNLKYIRSIEKERKEALEKHSAEFDLLVSEHAHIKEKLEASKARNNVLTTELKVLKMQMSTLIEKGKHDDELVDTLLKQQTHLQEMLSQLSQKGVLQQKDHWMMNKQQQTEEQRLECLVKQLQQMVTEKDNKIQELEEEMKKLMLEYTAISEDSCCSACVAKMAPLEAQCTEYIAKYKVASTEQERLQELNVVQQKRVEDLKQRCLEMEQRLQDERMHSVALEKELEKAKLELSDRDNTLNGGTNIPK